MQGFVQGADRQQTMPEPRLLVAIERQ